MADFGTYSAFQGRRNWGQVRQDRMMEMSMLKQMEQDLKQRVEAEAQSRAGLMDYFNQLNQVSVLDKDLERVRAREEQERKRIVEGIQKSGNSVQRYLLGNGAAELSQYRNNVMTSEEMLKARSNKLAYAQAMVDKQMGRIHRPIFDDQGNRISFEDQLQMFDQGTIDELQYRGSVAPLDPVKIRQIAQSTYGENRYKRQSLTEDDVRRLAMELGAEDWMAEDIAQGYTTGIDAGAKPISWRWDEAPRATPSLSDLRKFQEMALGNTDMYYNYLMGSQSQPEYSETKEWAGGIGFAPSPINDEILGKLTQGAMLRRSSDGTYYTPNGTAIDWVTGQSFDLSEAEPIKPEDILDYVTAFDEEENAIAGYLRVNVDLPQKVEKRIGRKEGDDRWMSESRRKQQALIPVGMTPFDRAQGRFANPDEERMIDARLEDRQYLFNSYFGQ